MFIAEPTDRNLTPYLFQGGTYRSYAILAPSLKIAREENKRYGGSYVGIDNRHWKDQQFSTVAIIARESAAELHVRSWINSGDLPIPNDATPELIHAFIRKVAKWDIDRRYKLVGDATTIATMIAKIKHDGEF